MPCAATARRSMALTWLVEPALRWAAGFTSAAGALDSAGFLRRKGNMRQYCELLAVLQTASRWLQMSLECVTSDVRML